MSDVANSILGTGGTLISIVLTSIITFIVGSVLRQLSRSYITTIDDLKAQLNAIPEMLMKSYSAFLLALIAAVVRSELILTPSVVDYGHKALNSLLSFTGPAKHYIETYVTPYLGAHNLLADTYLFPFIDLRAISLLLFHGIASTSFHTNVWCIVIMIVPPAFAGILTLTYSLFHRNNYRALNSHSNVQSKVWHLAPVYFALCTIHFWFTKKQSPENEVEERKTEFAHSVQPVLVSSEIFEAELPRAARPTGTESNDTCARDYSTSDTFMISVGASTLFACLFF